MKKLSQEDLKEVFGTVVINTGNRKKEPYQFQCKNCGQHKEVDGNLIWRKFCDIKCFKEYLQEQKDIKRILASSNR